MVSVGGRDSRARYRSSMELRKSTAGGRRHALGLHAKTSCTASPVAIVVAGAIWIAATSACVSTAPVAYSTPLPADARATVGASVGVGGLYAPAAGFGMSGQVRVLPPFEIAGSLSVYRSTDVISHYFTDDAATGEASVRAVMHEEHVRYGLGVLAGAQAHLQSSTNFAAAYAGVEAPLAWYITPAWTLSSTPAIAAGVVGNFGASVIRPWEPPTFAGIRVPIGVWYRFGAMQVGGELGAMTTAVPANYSWMPMPALWGALGINAVL
jgi:hypothetical protein